MYCAKYGNGWREINYIRTMQITKIYTYIYTKTYIVNFNGINVLTAITAICKFGLQRFHAMKLFQRNVLQSGLAVRIHEVWMPADMFLLLVILIMYHVLGHSYVHLQSGHADMYSTIRLIRVESDVCKSVLMRFILWHLAFLGTRVKKQQNTYFFQPFRVEKIPTFGNVAFDWAVGDS